MISETAVAVAVDDVDIVLAIDQWLSAGRCPASVVRLSRRPWEYATSAPLELVVAMTSDCREYSLVLKHLGPRHATAQVRRVKPPFVVDARREIEVYRRLLAPSGIGAPLVGSKIDPATDSYWLLLEYIPGCRLFEVGEPTAWTAAARWLGAFHARVAALDTEALRQPARLIDCDREWYRVWIDRALRFFAAGGPSCSRHDGQALGWLAARYDRVIDRLLALPSTFIHGEFYPSNVIMTAAPEGVRPCPIDWETAAVGPGVLDLAALMAGEWSDQDRRLMAAAYIAGSGVPTRFEDLCEAVQYAHIHVAVQWLGWFGRRRAPDVQARDWLGDAIDRAEALCL